MLPKGDTLVTGKVKSRKRGVDGELIGRSHQQPILDTRLYEVEFPEGEVNTYTANVIAENMYSQCDLDGNQFPLWTPLSIMTLGPIPLLKTTSISTRRDDDTAVKPPRVGRFVFYGKTVQHHGNASLRSRSHIPFKPPNTQSPAVWTKNQLSPDGSTNFSRNVTALSRLSTSASKRSNSNWNTSPADNRGSLCS